MAFNNSGHAVHATVADFHVFLLKTLCSACCSGKCLDNNFRKHFPTCVCTFFEYGGLNEITLRGLFFLRCRELI